MIHRTLPTEAEPHPSGWAELPGTGCEITRLPVVDTKRAGQDGPLFARLVYRDALAVAAANGAELPRAEHLEALRACGLHVEPYTIFPDSILLDASEHHDAAFWARMRGANWNGQQPVCGAGKWWIAPQPKPGRASLMGWWTEHLERFGPRRGAGWIQLPPGPHDDAGHHDYGTLTMLIRPRAVGGADGSGEGIATADTEPCPSSAAPAADPAITFIKARNFTPATDRKIELVVLHSTENAIRPGVAHNVATWFGGPRAPAASSHYVVGPDEVLQCVAETDVAWAAPGANSQGIQVEQVGQAQLTDWARAGTDERAGRAVIERSAELVARICRRWDIPAERVDVAGLLAGRRGITTHAAVSEAFKRSTHQDPGLAGDRRWPWAEYLAIVRAA